MILQFPVDIAPESFLSLWILLTYAESNLNLRIIITHLANTIEISTHMEKKNWIYPINLDISLAISLVFVVI